MSGYPASASPRLRWKVHATIHKQLTLGFEGHRGRSIPAPLCYCRMIRVGDQNKTNKQMCVVVDQCARNNIFTKTGSKAPLAFDCSLTTLANCYLTDELKYRHSGYLADHLEQSCQTRFTFPRKKKCDWLPWELVPVSTQAPTLAIPWCSSILKQNYCNLFMAKGVYDVFLIKPKMRVSLDWG